MASSGLRVPSNRFLPPDPRVAEPYRFTPQLALRLGILGALALAVFGILFVRLWALQVLSGPQYLHAAQNNQLRLVRIQAPRGVILDRNGHELVTNVAGTGVQVWPADLPKKGAYREMRRLAGILDIPLAQITAQLQKRRDDPVTPVTVKESVSEDQVKYLYEHQADYPGVQIAPTYLRHYVWPGLAAQIVGYVGEISKQQLKHRIKHGYRLGDKIGQAGIEATYDSFLRGRAGVAQLRVDSLGRPRSALTVRQKPGGGDTVRLTLDLQLQRAAERALEYGIDTARTSGCGGCWAANGGAIVALNPRNGAILALASRPTYDPRTYVGRVTAKKLADAGLSPKTARHKNYPGIDRAIAGTYPAGSTFKPVTALAALQEHIISPYQSLECTGHITIAGQRFQNWDPYAGSPMSLPTAIAQSCDTYFYQLGKRFYDLPPERGHPLQAWAKRFGFGQKTGVDIGPESAGLLPTPEWRKAHFTKDWDPNWQIDRLWKPGDSIQRTIGQKDLLVTPLQMARFYALVANGGWLVQPHLLADVEQPGDEHSPGAVLHRFVGAPPQRAGIDPQALAVVKYGLDEATQNPLGTAFGVFSGFPIPISGKTGTAEKLVDWPTYTGELDQSWWCGYGPSNSPELVVCALIENGGHGATAAAPAALKVFEQFFGITASPLGHAHGD